MDRSDPGATWEMGVLRLLPETSTRVTDTDLTLDSTDLIVRGIGLGL